MWAVLTSKIAALAYALCVVLLSVAAGVMLIQRNDARAQVTTLTNTVGQLKGSLEFQNQMVQQEADLGTKKQKAAQSALQAATAAAKAADMRIAEIAALPVAQEPVQACLANSADDALLGKLK